MGHFIARGFAVNHVTLVLAISLSLFASHLPAAVNVYSQKEFMTYKARLQKRYDTARIARQKDLLGHKNNSEAQNKLVGQHEELIGQHQKMLDQQGKMLDQQSQMMEQQIHLFARQSRIVDQQNFAIDKYLNRLYSLTLFIFGLGIIVWMITILGGRLAYLHLRGPGGKVATLPDETTGKEAKAVLRAFMNTLNQLLAYAGGKWRKTYVKVRDTIETGQQYVVEKLDRRKSSWARKLSKTNVPEDEFAVLLEKLSDELGPNSALCDQHSLALEALMDGDKPRATDHWLKAAEVLEGQASQQAEALFNAAVLSEAQSSITLYDELVKRYGEDSEHPQREWVAKSLVNKSAMLDKLGRYEEALGVDEEVVARFGDATEPYLLERVAKALLNKGVTLDLLGRHDESLQAYEDVVERFGSATDLSLRERVARALVYRGDTLDLLDRQDEAMSAYDEVLARFGSAPESTLRARVAIARNNKGCVLIKQARENWLDKDWRLQKLAEAKRCFSEALIDFEDKPLVMANQTYTQLLLGEQEHSQSFSKPWFARWGRRQPEVC